MFNLFNLISTLFNGSLDMLIDITSIISILFGISVINSKNPIVSVLFLIGLFISVSLNIIWLGYNFIGLSYLLVYVGAISILFLFILMLINIRISELFSERSNSMPLAFFAGIFFGIPLYFSNHINTLKNIELKNLLNSVNNNDILKKLIYETKDKLCETNDTTVIFYNEPSYGKIYPVMNECEVYYVTSNSWDSYLVDLTDISSVGNVLYSTYGIWLIICSIILLLAMIGAITITKKEKD